MNPAPDVINKDKRPRHCADSTEAAGNAQRPVIRGRMTWSMIRELRLVVPSVSFGPVYRVTGDWEKLVESRQYLEWIRAFMAGAWGAILVGPAYEPSGFVAALKIYALLVLMHLVLAGLDALWAARRAADLELVDRASSGLDEWYADRRRQRSLRWVLVVAMLLSAIGAWMLWSMTQADSWMNPWLFGPAALLLIGVSIRDVVRKWRNA
jgi:hypothetical protein